MNPFLRAEVNWFYQNASELIDWVAHPQSDSTFIWTASNFSHIKRSGIEIAYELVMENILKKKCFLKKIQISYNFINSDLLGRDLTSRYVLENLRHQLILGVDHKIFWEIHHHFKARFNQRESESSYWVLDSRIYWNSQRGHMVFVEATNLSNSQYTEVMTPMPGRWFRAGITYQFDFN